MTDPPPDPYRLTNEPTPPRKYIPLPDERPERLKHPGRRRDVPFRVHLMEWDPFPWIMVLATLAWIGLGLGARRVPELRFVLTGLGVGVMLLGQLYLFALIFRESTTHGTFSVISDVYRSFYLRGHGELVWKPLVISGCGLLMMLTGSFGMFHARP